MDPNHYALRRKPPLCTSLSPSDWNRGRGKIWRGMARPKGRPACRLKGVFRCELASAMCVIPPTHRVGLILSPLLFCLFGSFFGLLCSICDFCPLRHQCDASSELAGFRQQMICIACRGRYKATPAYVGSQRSLHILFNLKIHEAVNLYAKGHVNVAMIVYVRLGCDGSRIMLA